MLTLALICPGLYFLLRGKFLQGILSLVMQCTLIGWLPATVWALDYYTRSKYILAKQKVMASRAASAKANAHHYPVFPMKTSIPPFIHKIPVLPLGLKSGK